VTLLQRGWVICCGFSVLSSDSIGSDAYVWSSWADSTLDAFFVMRIGCKYYRSCPSLKTPYLPCSVNKSTGDILCGRSRYHLVFLQKGGPNNVNDSEMLLVPRMISVDIYFPEIYFILIGLSRHETWNLFYSYWWIDFNGREQICLLHMHLWSGIYRVTVGRFISFVASRRVDSDRRVHVLDWFFLLAQC